MTYSTKKQTADPGDPIKEDYDFSIWWEYSIVRCICYTLLLFLLYILLLLFLANKYPNRYVEFRLDTPEARTLIIEELNEIKKLSDEVRISEIDKAITAMNNDDLFWWYRWIPQGFRSGQYYRHINVTPETRLNNYHLDGLHNGTYPFDAWELSANANKEELEWTEGHVLFKKNGMLHPKTPPKIKTGIYKPKPYTTPYQDFMIPLPDLSAEERLLLFITRRAETSTLNSVDPFVHSGPRNFEYAKNVFFAIEPTYLYDNNESSYRLAGWKPIIVNSSSSELTTKNLTRFWTRWVLESRPVKSGLLFNQLKLTPPWFWLIIVSLPAFWVWRNLLFKK
jgi:hypothetical protein